jgi:hypothetical protein
MPLIGGSVRLFGFASVVAEASVFFAVYALIS